MYINSSNFQKQIKADLLFSFNSLNSLNKIVHGLRAMFRIFRKTVTIVIYATQFR